MARVEMNVSNFKQPYSWANGTTFERISSLDICRAVITVGAIGTLDLIGYGWRYCLSKLFEGLHRTLLVTANGNELVTSDAFNALVQTEKTTATYWLGMSLTKIAADRRLNVHWLCHVERLIDQGVLNLGQSTSKRGDLAGKDRQSLWHVFEAKGRSYNISSTTINDAKYQASRVKAIKGRPPATASACITKLFTVPISVDLTDPEPNSDSNISWDISESRFFPAYYEPFIRHLETSSIRSTRVLELDYITAQVQSLGPNMWIGLPKAINDNPMSAIEVANNLHEKMPQSIAGQNLTENENLSIGYDGILLSEGFPGEVT